MLRIVLELHHVEVPVGAKHQLALRSAPHPPDVLHHQNCQARSFASSGVTRILNARAGRRCVRKASASSFELASSQPLTLHPPHQGADSSPDLCNKQVEA
jgi:hypothetical protein